jgi:hypothetical protein
MNGAPGTHGARSVAVVVNHNVHVDMGSRLLGRGASDFWGPHGALRRQPLTASSESE